MPQVARPPIGVNIERASRVAPDQDPILPRFPTATRLNNRAQGRSRSELPWVKTATRIPYAEGVTQWIRGHSLSTPATAAKSSTPLLPRHPFQMHSPGLCLTFAFSASARAAKLGVRINESFRGLVPPFLLSRRPHFFASASFASEITVDVVTSPNEIGCAVAIIRSEILNVDRNALALLFSQDVSFCFFCTNDPFRFQLSAPLLTAFHLSSLCR